MIIPSQRRRRAGFFACLIVAVHSLCVISDALAQQDAGLLAASVEEITARIETLQAADAPAVADRDALISSWTETITAIKERTQSAKLQSEHEARAAQAPTDLAAVRETLASETTSQKPLEPAQDATIADLKSELARIDGELKTARTTSVNLAGQLANQRERLTALPEVLAALRTQLEGMPEIAAVPADATELIIARLRSTRAKKAALETRITELDAERAAHAATETLTTARIDLAAHQIVRLSRQETAWRKAVDSQEEATAQSAVEQARTIEKQVAEIPPLKNYAQINTELAVSRSEVSEDSTAANASKAREEIQYDKILEESAASGKRVQLLESARLGIDPEVSALLREQRQQLPRADDLRSSIQENLRASARAEIKLIKMRELARLEVIDAVDERARLIQAGTELNSKAEPAKAESVANRLVEDRRHLRSELIDSYQNYIHTLQDTNKILQGTIQTAENYGRFLDERLIWIPSALPLGIEDFKDEARAVQSLFSIQALKEWSRAILNDALRHWLLWCITAVALASLLLKRKQILQAYDECGTIAGRRNCTTLAPTMKAGACVVMLAAPLPLLLGRLAISPGSPSFAAGFSYAAIFSALIGNSIVACRPNGLLHSHFRMDTERTALIHKELKWFLLLMLPTIFLVTALNVRGEQGGRIFFIVAMILVLILSVRMLRPAQGLIVSRNGPSSLAKLWLVIGAGIPLSLIVGAVLGYFTSVLSLRQLVVISLWLCILVWLITQFALRWILVSRRKLATDQAVRRREAFLAERNRDSNDDASRDTLSLEEVKAAAVDVVEVEEQTSRLVRAAAVAAVAFGLWAIWASTLPALSILNRVNVWPETSTLVPTATAPAPVPGGGSAGTSPTTSSQDLPAIIRPATGNLNLLDIVGALIALALTFVAARNIPGLLELTLLRRLKLKPGGSFAFTTTVRYFLVVTGIVIAFGKIGITWTNVQWMAAAVTFGIGFGLQEVFANFVSGLILLFERPVRLGDVVTIGDVSGRVSQIRIRATTILQFNNRELVVPNKEFITGKLVNWTLSDGILRFEIPVGIAYGSDTEKAREILLKLATDHPNVISSPAPDVLFKEFADSSLLFELRAHVGTIEDLLPVRNELFFAVDQAFREAGIEIAFPQSDIHIRSVPPELKLSIDEKP